MFLFDFCTPKCKKDDYINFIQFTPQIHWQNIICINRFEAISICIGQCLLQDQLSKDEKNEKKYPNLRQ